MFVRDLCVMVSTGIACFLFCKRNAGSVVIT